MGAKLSDADLSGADLRRTNLIVSNLASANLNKVNLSSADLKSAILDGTDISGADLSNADLKSAMLEGANLSNANLSRAKLGGANLGGANLSEANLSNAFVDSANLYKANLRGANLSGARLCEANLNNSDLTRANLASANLNKASFVETNLEGADLSNSRIYGISAWNLKTNQETKQLSLVITLPKEPIITVDDLEVAQFIYLLLNNEKIRNVIDTIGKKAVLIIGRFTEERKVILHAIRDELRNRYDLLPIMFEFDPLSNQPTIKTLSTLAHLSRFVIADLTDAKSILQELTKILHDLPTLPVQPIIHEASELPPMADGFLIQQSFLKPHIYSTKTKLIADLPNNVVAPAVDCAKKMESKLAEIRQKWLPWQHK